MMVMVAKPLSTNVRARLGFRVHARFVGRWRADASDAYFHMRPIARAHTRARDRLISFDPSEASEASRGRWVKGSPSLGLRTVASGLPMAPRHDQETAGAHVRGWRVQDPRPVAEQRDSNRTQQAQTTTRDIGADGWQAD
jgi:hypothetical protein